MLLFSSASAEICDLLNPNACGLYDCGGNSWSPDETQGNGDNLSLRSGPVNMIGSSKVCIKATGPGLVRFVWKVDPTAQHVGTLGFWVDNAQVAVCKSQGWTSVSYSLRENKDYVLAWQFHKFKSIPAGMGAGWIKNIDVINAVFNESKRVDDHGPSYRGDSCSEFSNNSLNGVSPGSSVASPPNITMIVELYPSTNVTVNIPQININPDSGTKDQNKQITIDNDVDVIYYHTSNQTNDTKDVLPSLEKLHEVHVYANETQCSDCCQQIKNAIESVETGGIVRIHNGTYNCTEGLMSINKSLHLVGDNKSNTTIVSHSDKGIFVEGNNITIENISLVCKNSLQPVTMGVHAVSGEGLTIKHCNISGFTIGICVNDTRKLSILENYITSIRESNYYPRTQDYGTHKSIIAIMITKSNWNLYRNRDFIIENNTMSLGKSDDIRSYGIWIGGIQYAPANLTTKWLDNNETHNSISVNCCKIYRKSGEVCCCDEEYLCS